ncbi:MAG: hypothetical protein A3A97_04205 [Candidatus Terrybacteria bacterium RIFCSPLOWO2_01_FULL_40_23]|uniref:VWFA domain-containing protein n=1 Tax=Candidatus Terrybacteria bacterium RIFCSPLOWO2_01_FULL_40_23 TaxID=1802366 RepID=A0A1G2PQJ9_9BACT|nr:MAG: hypothetical protein A3A97_04205 [Candidatus Terrybacteria bacterium RIFCSPLOWO2_01_FULL_40_23]
MIENLLNLFSEKLFIFGFVIVYVLLLAAFLFRRKTGTAIRYSSYQDLKSARSRAKKVTTLVIVLFVSSLVSTALVMVDTESNSSSGGDCVIRSTDRRDTMIVQDISGSMIVMGEPKFELTRSVTLRILGANPNENIGLAFFSTIAFAPIAPTNCHALFESFTDKDFYETQLLKNLSQGTDGSAGLRVAQHLLELSDAKYKRIVFVGDLEDNNVDTFIKTLKEVKASGIEVQLVGIESSSYYYESLMAYGFDILKIENEDDAERIGPLPEDFSSKESFYFSSKLNQKQISIGWFAMAAFISALLLNFYFRRSYEIRRER